MILVDLNLLLYAVNPDAVSHAAAKAWLEEAVSGTETILMPWSVILGFLRLTTRPGVFSQPIPVAEACDVIEHWLAQPAVITIDPGPRHLGILRQLLETSGTGGNLTTDAHLAALALENNAELCSSDSDFTRFGKLRWRNPIALE